MTSRNEDLHVRADSASLGSAVRTRRRELGLRQVELADLADVSERFVHTVEAGKPTVQLDKVLAVLAAIGLHLELHRGAADTSGTDRVDRPHAAP